MKKVLFNSLVVGAAMLLCFQLSAQSRYKTGNTAKPAPKTTDPAQTAPAATKQNTNTAPKQSGSRYLNAGAANKAAVDTGIKNNTTTTPTGTGSSRYRPGNNTAAPTPTNNTAGSSASTTTGTVSGTINYDTTIQGGFETKPEISLRNNYAVDRSRSKDRKPLEYDDIRVDDELFSEMVWREIDAREKINQSFMYPGKEDNGDQRFFSILLSAITNDSVVAFSSDNDRFTKPLTISQVMTLIGGVYDTVDVIDPVTGVSEKTITKKPKFNPDSVYTFRLKEQVVFDKETSRLTTRIIGVAPIAKVLVAGKPTPRLLFWVYYPDIRKTLNKFEVYNPKNFASRMTWEELFEGRFFSSYITKTSMNNPTDKTLAGMIKDPMFRLLEGENLKQRLFNFEQDLWAY